MFEHLLRIAGAAALLASAHILIALYLVERHPELVYYHDGTLAWQLQALATSLTSFLLPLALGRSSLLAVGLALGLSGMLGNVIGVSLWPGAPNYFAFQDWLFNLPDVAITLGGACVLVSAFGTLFLRPDSSPLMRALTRER